MLIAFTVNNCGNTHSLILSFKYSHNSGYPLQFSGKESSCCDYQKFEPHEKREKIRPHFMLTYQHWIFYSLHCAELFIPLFTFNWRFLCPCARKMVHNDSASLSCSFTPFQMVFAYVIGSKNQLKEHDQSPSCPFR